MNKKDFWTGIGIGVAVGGVIGATTAHILTKRKVTKSLEASFSERRKAAYKKGYDRGTEDAVLETQKWIDENILVVDADNPAEAQKAIESHFKGNSEAKDSGEDRFKVHSEAHEAGSGVRDDIGVNDIEKALESPKNGLKIDSVSNNVDHIFTHGPIANTFVDNSTGAQRFVLTDSGMVNIKYHEEIISYPQELFFDENGYSVGETRLRTNLMDYEKNPITLKKVWLALGWGDYFPDPGSIALTEEELNNMDLNIDEKLGDEPEEKTLERQRYLDKVEKYRENPENCPKIVPRKRFEEDCYMEHIFVDYYEDNVFIDSTDMNNPIDAYTMFGVTDGKDLFRYKKEHPFDPDEDDNDPDIVHVENFMMNTIAEITRPHRTFESLKDGSAYFDGGTT